MSWRHLLTDYLSDDASLTDVYEFGVYTAQSMIDIDAAFKKRKMEYRKFFGFDSFEGLPSEDKEEIGQSCWAKGGFNAQTHFGVHSVADCVEATQSFLEERNVYPTLIPGFYENVLNKKTLHDFDLGTAKYVDIDVDLYSSTVTVLEFLFSHKIIRPGTIIGYDDYGGSPGWKMSLDGESRAHREMLLKYNVRVQQLFQYGNSFPHVATAFKVI